MTADSRGYEGTSVLGGWKGAMVDVEEVEEEERRMRRRLEVERTCLTSMLFTMRA